MTEHKCSNLCENVQPGEPIPHTERDEGFVRMMDYLIAKVRHILADEELHKGFGCRTMDEFYDEQASLIVSTILGRIVPETDALLHLEQIRKAQALHPTTYTPEDRETR